MKQAENMMSCLHKNSTEIVWSFPPLPPLAKVWLISGLLLRKKLETFWDYPPPPMFGKRTNLFRFFLMKASLTINGYLK